MPADDVLPDDRPGDRYDPASTAQALAAVRQIGGSEIVFGRAGAATIAAEVGERGGYRVRVPRGEHGAEAVLINTGGGMVGGDHATHRIDMAADCEALVTTPAAERIYRTLGPATDVRVQMTVAANARLVWLPQETILYDGAAFNRQLEVDLAKTARLLMLELTVLGRAAMGETIQQASFVDRWRVRQGGRLVFAETVTLSGALAATMAKPAIGGGASVIATLLYVGHDAGDRLPRVRAVLAESTGQIGASAWNHLLVVRSLGTSLSAVRGDLAQIIPVLMDRPMPRMWWT
jgi:urease accessory protein